MRSRLILPIAAAIAVVATAAPAYATPCMEGATSQGQVVAALDATTFMLADGRTLRLAGIVPADVVVGAVAAGDGLAIREVGRDRYGRVLGFVVAEGFPATLQEQLVAQGAALATHEAADAACRNILKTAESAARSAGRGLWRHGAAIKNAESTGDHAAIVGRFVLFEGKVLSVRQAGATIYLNFGRRAANALTVSVSERARADVETGAPALGQLAGRRVRIRGWAEDRGGLRVEVSRPGQIEAVD